MQSVEAQNINWRIMRHVDISRQKTAAPAGVRYLRKPDDDESRPHGAVGPARSSCRWMWINEFGSPLLREDPFQAPPTWTRTKTKGSKDPCAAITPWGTAIKPEVFRRVYYVIGGHHPIPRVGRFRR